MATITGRRVQVLPISVTSGHTATATTYGDPYDAVYLTEGRLRQLGGVPYRVGQTWGVFLNFKYLDSDGAMTAWDLTNSALVMRIYHKSTLADVDSRTQDTVITGSVYEIEVTGDAADGQIKIVFYQTETPTAGCHAFEIIDTVSTVAEVVARGEIDILPALPAAT